MENLHSQSIFKVEITDLEAAPTVSITNIYYDCLERIFDFLDLESLLNVANTCKRLQIAAAAKFSDEHGAKTIYFRPSGVYGVQNGIFDRHNEEFFVDDEFFLVGRKFRLPFLRCFGSKISHLNLHLGGSNEYKTIVYQYINQYCANTLTGFTFWNFEFEKPFRNLEKVEIWFYLSGTIFENLNNWCPNVRHLEVDDDYCGADSVAVNFPHLEHLRVFISQKSINYNVALLKANLQLQSVEICMFDIALSAVSLLLNLIQVHQSISKLKVQLDDIAHVTAAESLQLANEHPSITELNLLPFQFTVADAVALIRQLKSLKKFEFCVQDEAECIRIRDQLDDGWRFEYRLIEELEFFEMNCDINPVYAIDLKRTH